MSTLAPLLPLIASFSFIALASKDIGAFFSRYKLPLITGFLFAGMAAGPYGLDLITKDATRELRFVDEIALAFIAFAAASELYLQELKSRIKTIKWVTILLVGCTFTIGSAGVFFLCDHIAFTADLPGRTKLAIALLTGAILVARSPSSAIAIIKEMRAKGPFTQGTLGVTVVMDIVVIVVFAVNLSLADMLITASAFNLVSLVLVLGEIMLSFALGFMLSFIIRFILMRRFLPATAKTGLILGLGYLVFILSDDIRHSSSAQLGFELLLEPLLICMTGSFFVANFTEQRRDLLDCLALVEKPVYIAFFTLTGASLTLDILGDVWDIALALVLIRLFAIFLGSYLGGTIAGDPPKHNRNAWMAYITQAGVGLGLAKEIATTFESWGPSLATLIISVIVINQLIGPPFFKWVLFMVDEARPKAEGETTEKDQPHNAVIFGVGGRAFALSRQLKAHGWQTRILYVKNEQIGAAAPPLPDIRGIDSLDIDTFKDNGVDDAATIICMLGDEENYKIAEIAYENYPNVKIVVRLSRLANYERFRALGALVVSRATAMVNLLEHCVRSPMTMSLMLGMGDEQSLTELEIRDPSLEGHTISDIRIPTDVTPISVSRGDMVNRVSRSYSFKVGDIVTFIGPPDSFQDVQLLFKEPEQTAEENQAEEPENPKLEDNSPSDTPATQPG